MLNHPLATQPMIMTPEGSLNRLPVDPTLLAETDPLKQRASLTGSDLMSRQALIELLQSVDHPHLNNLRDFLSRFDPTQTLDQHVLHLFAQRFHAVIETTRHGDTWRTGTAYQQALQTYWQSVQTLSISGGLTSAQFGVNLAEQVEQRSTEFAVISSPWGGLTALYGLAQTVAQEDDLLVMDFGATGIKRAIAHKFGNRLTLLPELKVRFFKDNGLIRKKGLIACLQQTRQLLESPLPIAISMASYLSNGHPFDYFSGIYHRLGEDCEHLFDALNLEWLPGVDLGELKLLEHDSTSAALAFRFRQPAMMVTLGTGLGSAPCPMLP